MSGLVEPGDGIKPDSQRSNTCNYDNVEPDRRNTYLWSRNARDDWRDTIEFKWPLHSLYHHP